MNRYMSVFTKIFTKELFRVKSAKSKLVGIYLMVCNHANMTGAYYITRSLIGLELEMTVEDVTQALRDLEDAEVAFYDYETDQVYVPLVLKMNVGEIPQPKDNRPKLVQSKYFELDPSFICDLFWNDYGASYRLKQREDAGKIPRPARESRQITMPLLEHTKRPQSESPPPTPPDNREEIDSLMKRYTTEQRLKIVEVWKLVALTRKSGKIAESIILAEMRRWSRVEIRRVMYGIEKYIDRGYHTEKKGESYLYGIMLKSGERDINAHMAMGPSNGSGPPRVSAVTEHNMAVFEQLRREREDHDLDS